MNRTETMAVLTPSVGVSAPARVTARDNALDFTKGLFVLFMVLYHWLNYFFGPEGYYYNYLRFLTPGFIFITGFMISHIHLRRYGTANSRLPGRLFIRGLKLLAVFVGLNVLLGLVLPSSLVRRSLLGGPVLGSLSMIFLSGNLVAEAGQKGVAFNILVPFAYLLILSAGLVALCARFKHVFYYACALSVVAVIVVNTLGLYSLNLELVMAGLFGAVFGYATKEQVLALTKHPLLISGLYCAFLAIVSIRDVTLPLQMVSVILTTSLFYMLGTMSGFPRIIHQLATQLGKYSLLAYISQIAVLQALRRILSSGQHRSAVLVGSLGLGVLLTILIVEVVHRARARSNRVNQMYEWIFA